MKQVFSFLILSLCIAIIFAGCSHPSYIFYNSEAGIPTISKSTTSEFTQITKIEDYLPFAVIAATDKNIGNKVTAKYVLLSPPYMVKGTVEDYVHPYNVTLSTEKVSELLKAIEKSIGLFDSEREDEEGISIEYAVSKENNIAQVTPNVEVWKSDFRYIFKGFSSRNDAFVNLGLVQYPTFNLEYSYCINKDQAIEFKYRLAKALDILRSK